MGTEARALYMLSTCSSIELWDGILKDEQDLGDAGKR